MRKHLSSGYAAILSPFFVVFPIAQHRGQSPVCVLFIKTQARTPTTEELFFGKYVIPLILYFHRMAGEKLCDAKL